MPGRRGSTPPCLPIEKIVEAGFEYARAWGLKVIPTCPYVSHYFLKKRKEFLALVG